MGNRALRTKLRRDIRRQWPQFLAITITITLGVALFAASYDAFRNLQASYANLHVQLHSADLWITGGDTTGIATTARSTPGVEAVETRVQADVPVRVDGVDKLRGRVIGVPSGRQPEIGRLLAVAGTGTARGAQALVERHMSDHFGLVPGDTVEVLPVGSSDWRDLRVAGAVESAEYIWPARSRQEIITLPDDFGVLFVPADQARAIAGSPPNQVLVTLADDARPTTLDTLRSKAQEAGATEVLTRAEQPSNAALQEDIDGFSEMSAAFPLLFLTAAGMAAYVLVTRRVQSERTLIGMMLASGMHPRQVRRHYLGFGLAAGLTGAAIGVALGMAGARTMTRLYLGFIALPDEVAVFDLRAVTLLGGLGFGIAAGALSALPAALLAARVEPAEAMRGVAPATGGRRSLLERLVPPLRRLPARWRMVLRGIERNRRRTVYTILGVTLSLLLILASWSMLDTMDQLLSDQFTRIETEDARVDFTGPQEATVLGRLEAVDGVARVEPVTSVPVSISGPDGSYGSVLLALPSDTTMHGFVRADGTSTSLSDAGVLVGLAARERIGVPPGEQATLQVPDLGVRAPVTVDGYLDEPLGTYVYASLDAVRQAADGPVPITSALLAFDAGVDRDTLRRTIQDLEFVGAYEDTQALVSLFDEYTGFFYGFVGVMLALGALMAFAIMFTTMSVNIVERSREVATLQASGVRLGQISRLISSENLIMTLLGVGPGLVAGVVGGRLLMDSYSSDLFRLQLVVRPTTLVVSALAIVGVAFVSQWPSLRAVRRLDIAAVVRERDT
jgi:putative ABC transport system permease protein